MYYIIQSVQRKVKDANQDTIVKPVCLDQHYVSCPVSNSSTHWWISNGVTMLLNTISLYHLCKNRFLNIMQCISVQLCVS